MRRETVVFFTRALQTASRPALPRLRGAAGGRCRGDGPFPGRTTGGEAALKLDFGLADLFPDRSINLTRVLHANADPGEAAGMEHLSGSAPVSDSSARYRLVLHAAPGGPSCAGAHRGSSLRSARCRSRRARTGAARAGPPQPASAAPRGAQSESVRCRERAKPPCCDSSGPRSMHWEGNRERRGAKRDRGRLGQHHAQVRGGASLRRRPSRIPSPSLEEPVRAAR